MLFSRFKNTTQVDRWCIHGNVNAKYYVAGHSNSFAMMLAVKSNPNHENNFAVFYECEPNRNEINRDSEYWKFVKENLNGRKLIISWNGNLHNAHFLLDTKEAFRVYPYIMEPPSAPVVSIKSFEALFEYKFKELREIIEYFPSSKDLIFIGTPPPKPKVYIDEILSNEIFFQNIALELGINVSEMQASSDLIRVGVWKITQDLLQEIVCEYDCKFIPVPDSAMDSNGLLLEKFWSPDVTHANEQFGNLMLDEISNFNWKSH